MNKKPKTIKFLIVIFAWSILKEIEILTRYKTVTDYQILKNNSIEYLFFIFVILLIVLNILTLWFLIKPKKIGFNIAITTLIVSFINSSISAYFGFKDLEFVKKAYILSRESRGLKIDENTLNFFFNSPTAYLIGILTFFWLALLLFLFLKNKNYFLNAK